MISRKQCCCLTLMAFAFMPFASLTPTREPRMTDSAWLEREIEALEDANPSRRRQAAEGLAGEQTGVQGLIACLDDRVEEIAMAASKSIAEVGVPALPAILDGLAAASDRKKKYSFAAIEQIALTHAGKRQKSEDLAQDVAENVSSEVKLSLASHLSDTSAEVREKAAIAIGLLGKPPAEAESQLLRMLRQRPSNQIAAAFSLCRFSSLSEASVRELSVLIDDANEEVKLAAIMAFVELGQQGKCAAPKLAAISNEAKSPIVLERCAMALGRAGDGSKCVVDSLLKQLTNGDGGVRLKAAEALERLDPGNADALLAATNELRSEDRSQRLAAATSLSAFEFAEGVRAALKFGARDTDPTVRRACRDALTTIEDLSKRR